MNLTMSRIAKAKTNIPAAYMMLNVHPNSMQAKYKVMAIPANQSAYGSTKTDNRIKTAPITKPASYGPNLRSFFLSILNTTLCSVLVLIDVELVIGESSLELLDVGDHYILKRKSKSSAGLSDHPDAITELLLDVFLIDFASLVDLLENTGDLTGLRGQAVHGMCKHSTRIVDRARGGADGKLLILVRGHDEISFLVCIVFRILVNARFVARYDLLPSAPFAFQ